MGDYNLQLEMLNAVKGREDFKLTENDRNLSEIQELTLDMQKLQQFLSWANHDAKKEAKIDWREDMEKRRLVDELATKYDFFESGVYHWEGKEIDAFNQSIQGEINNVLSPQMSQKWNEQNQSMQEINALVDIATNVNRSCEELRRRINNHMGQK